MGLLRRKPEFQIDDRVLKRGLDVVRNQALRRGVRAIDPRYLLFAVFSTEAPLVRRLFHLARVDVASAAARLEALLDDSAGVRAAWPVDRAIPYTPEASRAFELSAEEADDMHPISPRTEHLLLALLRQNGEAAAFLYGAGLTLQAAREHLTVLRQEDEG